MNKLLTVRGIVAGLLMASGQAWRAVRRMRNRLADNVAGTTPLPPSNE
jgi:hypothetical protein